MKYEKFLNSIRFNRTASGQCRGVRCNIALYMYPDGHGNFYFTDDAGKWVTYNKKPVSMPSNDKLETVDIFIDILNLMHKKAKAIR